MDDTMIGYIIAGIHLCCGMLSHFVFTHQFAGYGLLTRTNPLNTTTLNILGSILTQKIISFDQDQDLNLVIFLGTILLFLYIKRHGGGRCSF